MCGIVGVFGDLYPKDKTLFKNALVADSVRGFDSTGIATAEWVPKDSEHKYYYRKDVMTGAEAVRDQGFTKMIENYNVEAIIGHNRWATIGNVNAANAHPFSHPGIVLVHNGTLDDTRDLKGNFDTDSEEICYEMSISDNPIDVLEKLMGAYALVWFDLNDGTINFARNHERDLYLVCNKNEDVVYFASEGKMLEWVADRNNIKLFGDPVLLPVGEVWSFSLNKIGNGRKLSPKITKFKPMESVYDWGKYYGSGYGSYAQKPKPKDLPERQEMVEFLVTGVKENVNNKLRVDIKGVYISPDNNQYTVNAWSLPKDKYPTIADGDIYKARVSSVGYACLPVTIYIETGSLEQIEDFSCPDDDEDILEQCGNCLQYFYPLEGDFDKVGYEYVCPDCVPTVRGLIGHG